VILGGDLVEYLETSNEKNQYRNNFLVFLDIILGVNRENSELPDDEEYKNNKELLVPLFTLTGNHDYRKAHYDMVFSGTYKVFGFTEEEIVEYKDQKKFKPLQAIKSNIRQLRDYLVFINPTLNYMVDIGDHFNVIFIDTGADSLREFYELLKGGSSTKGLKDYQIDIFRSEAIQSKDHSIIAILHSPPISPKVSTLKRIKFKKKASLGSLDFYSKKFKVFMGAGRIDNVINLKYQSFKDHWSSLLKILIGKDLNVKRKLNMVLCGHTHTSVEYKLIETEEDQVFRRGVVFAPSYVRLPCDTVTGEFTNELNKISDPNQRTLWLKENQPLILQTQGLGPFAHRSKFVPPGFRYLSVKNNQIAEIRTYSLHLKE